MADARCPQNTNKGGVFNPLGFFRSKEDAFINQISNINKTGITSKTNDVDSLTCFFSLRACLFVLNRIRAVEPW